MDGEGTGTQTVRQSTLSRSPVYMYVDLSISLHHVCAGLSELRASEFRCVRSPTEGDAGPVQEFGIHAWGPRRDAKGFGIWCRLPT